MVNRAIFIARSMDDTKYFLFCFSIFLYYPLLLFLFDVDFDYLTLAQFNSA